MSIHQQFAHGPIARTKLDLMGIRFGDLGGDGSGAGGDGGNGGGDGGSPKPYAPPASQDEMDRIIETRLARERDKFKDYDELKAAKTQFDELTESQKSEAQKAIDLARGEGTTEATQRFLSRLVNSEVRSIATALGFNDPTDAMQVIDAAKLPVKDDEADADAIKALIEKLATDKPYLVKGERPTPRTRPKPKTGEPTGDKAAPGKGAAAAALRQLSANRRND